MWGEITEMKSYFGLTAESEEFLYLDALRIVASFCIVIYHFSAQFDATTWSPGGKKFFHDLSLAVDLFFVISGYIICNVYGRRVETTEQYKEFMFKRFARLVPLHIVTFSIYFCVGAVAWMGIFTPNHPEAFQPRCIVPSLFLLQPFNFCDALAFNGVTWSIGSEMLMYFALPAVLILVRRPVVGLVVALATVIALTIIGRLLHWEWTAAAFDFGFVRAIPAFIFGAVCWSARGHLAKLKFTQAGFWGCCLLIGAGLIAGWDRLVLLFLMYLLVMLAAAASFKRPSRLLEAIAPLGQLTYSIYMLHTLVNFFVLGFIGKRLLGLDGGALLVLAVASALLLFPLGWASLMYIEQPARRWLTRLFMRRRTEQAALG